MWGGKGGAEGRIEVGWCLRGEDGEGEDGLSWGGVKVVVKVLGTRGRGWELSGKVGWGTGCNEEGSVVGQAPGPVEGGEEAGAGGKGLGAEGALGR